jgi:uncharacterized repeat protein (TIGR01451 family)
MKIEARARFTANRSAGARACARSRRVLFFEIFSRVDAMTVFADFGFRFTPPRLLRAGTFALSCVFASALPFAAHAQTVWTGATGDWFDETNWSAGVPDASAVASIDNGGTAEIAAAGAAAATITLGHDVADTGFLTVSGSGNLGVVADLSVGYGGTGTLLVSDGAAVSDNSGEIGYSIDSTTGASGMATVQGAGSSWTSAYELYVGYGTGTLNILDGASVSDYYGYIGYYPEFPGRSNGIANIDGAGSTWMHASTFIVGDAGTGIMNVTNGGFVVNGEGDLGFGFDSDGTATIDGAGSLWSTNGFFYVGQNGNGTLHVANGGRVESHGSFAYVAYDGGSTSAATIDGPESVWHNDNGLYIGFDGDGTVAITNGGTLESGFFANIGFDTGASGAITLAGDGSRFVNGGTIAVGGNVGGAGGTGLLAVGAGANVDANAIAVWNTGTVEITAAPSGVGYLHASTTATLQGALTIDFADGDYKAGTYTLLQADGGLGGTTFASVAIGTPPAGFSADVTYDDDHVYLVLASNGGADLSVTIDAPAYVERGQAIDYAVTVHNAGPDDATGAAVASTLSPLLDVADASWACVSPSGCTDSGSGNLADTVNIPAGGEVSYVISASVLPDAGDGPIETSASATIAGDPNEGNDTASVSTAIVIFRDGFEGSASE